MPADFAMPEGGLNIRWPDPPLAQEARLLDYKWYAALAYVRANKLNRVVIDCPTSRASASSPRARRISTCARRSTTSASTMKPARRSACAC